jgi:UDP-N-acetylglucosamine 2-epimerase
MKIVSIVGARPQFIKCAPVSRELRMIATEVLVHTGQHYDGSMSSVFFHELGIPVPDRHLGIGSGSHGEQTGEMLKHIEQVLISERPDNVLVYGDTNSTLAGALAAAKLHVPVIHVEAGLRSFNRNMPEEINRVITDHLSDVRLCPTERAIDNLRLEGIAKGVHLVGDVMYDSLMDSVDRAGRTLMVLERLGLEDRRYLLVTVHRAENTDGLQRMNGIMSALRELAESGQTIVFPVHPRTHKVLDGLSVRSSGRLQLTEPLSYLDMVRLESSARMILTDSGGVQKEAYWLGVPCITLREETEWVETVESGWNRLVGADPTTILRAVRDTQPGHSMPWPWKRGEASKRSASIIAE